LTLRPRRRFLPCPPIAPTLALALGLALGAGVAAAEEPETWHAETLTSSPRGLQVTQYWSRGSDRLRAETVVAGHRLVTIVNGERYYSINVTQGTGVAIERNPRAIRDGKRRPRLVGVEGFLIRERGGEKVRSEAVAGRMCDVYKHTDASGRREVWVQQDASGELLPLRVEFYNRQAGAMIRTDYVQWASGLELPDRLFQPDPRFPIQEFGYEEYLKSSSESLPPVPVLHGSLLHGEK